MSKEAKLTIHVKINGEDRTLLASRTETLLDALRHASYTSVKHGCRMGECGACTVLLDRIPVHSCQIQAVNTEGHEITTLEGLSKGRKLHPVQQAFLDTGSFQCGYCTPAQILTAKALLDRKSNPTRDEIREAMSGVLCRCTGYVKIVQAVERASSILRGEDISPYLPLSGTLVSNDSPAELIGLYHREKSYAPPLVISQPDMKPLEVIGKPVPKVDGLRLVKGRPVFTDDIRRDGMLYGALLTSPHAHARIKSIDTSPALALPGVHAVLTHKDVPRIKYTSACQTYPEPGPYDQVVLDNKVRYVGDRVAVVAADSPETAQQALGLIDVQYEVLPHVLNPEEAVKEGAPVIHDEADTKGIFDPKRNIVHHIEAEVGEREVEWNKASHVFEGEYRTSQAQHSHIEPHVCITYFDNDERLIVRSSTQAPFHIRRMLAKLIGLPVKKIRVIKSHIGGGFGNKQEMILEDLCALLTIATGRPVRMEYSRRQEFTSSRSRHPQIMRYKIGVTKEGKIVATELYLTGDTGAYGTHGLTVQMVGAQRSLSLYNAPYIRFVCDVVYTNKPVAGAFRGYGAVQCLFGIETLMSEIAASMRWDSVEFKQKNWIKQGDKMLISKALGEGREGFDQVIRSSSLGMCVKTGIEAMSWYDKRAKMNPDPASTLRRGIGMSLMIHGTSIAGLDMGSATIKMNDDGSFNLIVGASDIGTGAHTILSQIAAEVLGVRVEDIIVYSSDTDLTPFDKGAYASSTTYISGEAVRKATLDVCKQVKEHARLSMGLTSTDGTTLRDRKVFSPDGRFVTLEQIGMESLHMKDQCQIIASASHTSYESPPPFGAQFVELTIDTETGEIRVQRALMVVDCGRVINPITASGQVEGGIAQALGFAHCEEMLYDTSGRLLNPRFGAYHIYKNNEMPRVEVIFIETDESSGPFGAKSIGEITTVGVAPAMADAIYDATGVWIREIPFTPERVWRALRDADKKKK